MLRTAAAGVMETTPIEFVIDGAVKLYVAEELQKNKNGKSCLAAGEEAKQLLAQSAPSLAQSEPSQSGNSPR
jgi:hypothetical protein